jgi:hypothetical protein
MSKTESGGWSFVRGHPGALAIFVLAGALVIAGAVYVFLWFVGDAQSTGLVPTTLGLWTVSEVVSFILHVIFWELLLVGVPVAIGAVVGWLWWRRLPYEERVGYHFGGRSRSAGGGSGVSLLLFIAFCIKLYLDGKWNAPIGGFTVNYVVGSMVLILEWALVVFGIPASIVAIWWLSQKTKA